MTQPARPNYDLCWRSRTHLTDRVGQKLRVLAVGELNSAWVEFEDGHHCVTSRFNYRRLAAPAFADRPSPETVMESERLI